MIVIFLLICLIMVRYRFLVYTVNLQELISYVHIDYLFSLCHNDFNTYDTLQVQLSFTNMIQYLHEMILFALLK